MVKTSINFKKHWLFKLPKNLHPYIKLARLERPIGTWLLFFPGCWGVLVAARDVKDLWVIGKFLLGALLMRSAGCVYNDYLDQDFDKLVKRTCKRPLAAGMLTDKKALLFLGILLFLSFFLLISFNGFTIILGLIALLWVSIYPFSKRWTYWPQAVLGLTFNWSLLMGYSAVTNSLTFNILPVFLAGFFWTIGYDTLYAYQDKQDDLLVGIKSTALLFQENAKSFLKGLYSCMGVMLLVHGILFSLNTFYYLILALAFAYITWQIKSVNLQSPSSCGKAFRENKWVGWGVTLALLLGSL